MHTGKYARRTPRRRRHNRKKASLLLTSLILLLTMLIGGTAAFLVASTGSVENAFTPTSVSSQVTESFNGSVKNNVAVKNTGTTSAYLRAMVIVNWKDGQGGNIAPTAPVKDVDYHIEWDTTGWIYMDGSYIYTRPVGPGESTPVLFTNCYPIEGKAPAGYDLNVEIICSAIQSTPADAVKSWGVNVAADGTLS